MNAQMTLNNTDNVDLFVTTVDHNLSDDAVCFPNQGNDVGAVATATVEIDGDYLFRSLRGSQHGARHPS